MVDKITSPITSIELINKTNEIIDNLGSGSGVSYSATCPAITPTSGVASWNVTHNLGTANILVSLYDSSGALQECNVTVTSANALTVTFKASSNVSAGDYKIVVLASGGTGGGGADVDLSNITDTGKLAITNFVAPSTTRIQVTAGASGTGYKAPADGWFWIDGSGSASSWGFIYATNHQKFATQGVGTIDLGINLLCPVAKNDYMYVYFWQGRINNIYFVYAKGSESEAS